MGLNRKLEKLPSVLTENKFNEKGLVETDSGLLVPAYVASELGFNFPGRYFLNEYFYPKLREAGVLPLCPFKACAEYLDFSKLNDEMTVREEKEFWEEFDTLIGIVNYENLMPKSKFMIALIEGARVDEGVASESAIFAIKHGRIIAIRTDFRLCENPVSIINAAVRYFIDKERGSYDCQFFHGPDAYDRAQESIKTLVERIKNGN